MEKTCQECELLISTSSGRLLDAGTLFMLAIGMQWQVASSFHEKGMGSKSKWRTAVIQLEWTHYGLFQSIYA